MDDIELRSRPVMNAASPMELPSRQPGRQPVRVRRRGVLPYEHLRPVAVIAVVPGGLLLEELRGAVVVLIDDVHGAAGHRGRRMT